MCLAHRLQFFVCFPSSRNDARIRWEVNFLLTFEIAPFFCLYPVLCMYVWIYVCTTYINTHKTLKYIHNVSKNVYSLQCAKKNYLRSWIFCVQRKKCLWPILTQDDYSTGSSLPFRHSSIGRNGKCQPRCVLGWLHTTHQLLTVSGSGFVRYGIFHPSDSPQVKVKNG